jgi:hypothetical protein
MKKKVTLIFLRKKVFVGERAVFSSAENKLFKDIKKTSEKMYLSHLFMKLF